MGFGQTLRLAREEQHLSISEVARRTLISSRYIIALEEEKWDELPEDVHVKGYIRSFARLLGLDGDALWQQALSGRMSSDAPQPLSSRLDERESGLVKMLSDLTTTEEDIASGAAALEANLRHVGPIVRRTDFSSSPKDDQTAGAANEIHAAPASGSDAKLAENSLSLASLPQTREEQARSRRAEYQKRQLLIRKRRIVISLIFWTVVVLAVIATAFFIYQSGWLTR